VSSNTFAIPEIVYDPSLVFSPHVILLGMIFDDQAFAAPSLTSPEELSRLNIAINLPLPLKLELANVPVFHRAIRTPQGWAISPTEPLTYFSDV
jgi:hypothetical protein